ncbi:hypothetical protein M569_11057, partial [Genlisea aurea]
IGMEDDEERPYDHHLPLHLLHSILASLACFRDLARASCVSRTWRQAAMESAASMEKLSFSGLKFDDDSVAKIVLRAHNLRELDVSASRRGCRLTDEGLKRMSEAKCVAHLTSISIWGSSDISDEGVVQMVSRAGSLQHLNLGGTSVSDISLFVVADSCPHLK